MTYLESDGDSIKFPLIAEPVNIDMDTGAVYVDEDTKNQHLKNYAGDVLQIGARGAMLEQIPKTALGSPVASLSLSSWSMSEQFNRLRILLALRADNVAYKSIIYRFNNDNTAGNYFGSAKAYTVSATGNYTIGNSANGAFGGFPAYFANGNAPAGMFDLIDITVSNYNQDNIAKSWKARIVGDFANSPTPSPWGAFANGVFYGDAIASLYIAFNVGNINTDTFYRAWVQ